MLVLLIELYNALGLFKQLYLHIDVGELFGTCFNRDRCSVAWPLCLDSKH